MLVARSSAANVNLGFKYVSVEISQRKVKKKGKRPFSIWARILKL